MKSMNYVVIGCKGFGVVDIDEHKKVGHLKKMIAEENWYTFPPKDLKLYVAKKDGDWLRESDPDVKRMEGGVVPAQIEDMMKKNGEMDASDSMHNTAFGFPDEENDEEGDIHFLVDIPEYVKEDIRRLRYNQSQELLMADELSFWDWLAAFFSSPTKASPSKKEALPSKKDV